MAAAHTERVTLTNRKIAGVKPKPGTRVEVRDVAVPGLRLRVSETGHRSWVLLARFPSSPNRHPTRLLLGGVYVGADDEPAQTGSGEPAPIRGGLLSLAQARQKARAWLAMLSEERDPRVEQERAKAAALRAQANSFGAVAEQFLERYAPTIKKQGELKRIFEKDFLPRWRSRPLAEVTAGDAAAAIRSIAKRGIYEAHNAFGHLRRFFSWAASTGEFGNVASPMAALSPSDVIGAKRAARERVLDDGELRDLWHASAKLGYPYAPLVRLLVLSGQRVSEISDLTWPEITLDQRLITIPAQRMKGGRAHEILPGPMALGILADLDKLRREPPLERRRPGGGNLPLYDRGSFVFSTTHGERPVNSFGKMKLKLDKLIATARAESRGGAGTAPTPADYLPPWTLHDIRRSARTGFSALPGVSDLVRELTIAHAKPQLHGVYDRHAYRDEKAECLRLWEVRLSNIIVPKPPATVADLGEERAKRAEG
jgi:integrase